MVKQIRRMQSLQRRLQRLESTDEIWESTWISLWEEWAAILRFTNQGYHFQDWVNDIPELSPLPTNLPTQEWLCLAQQFLQHELQSQIHREQKIQRDKLAMQHKIDCKDGHKKLAFAKIRDQITPPFNRVELDEEDFAVVVTTEDKAVFDLHVDRPSRFSMVDPITVHDRPAKILQIDEDTIRIQMLENADPLPEEVEIRQHIRHFQVQEVFQELTKYWSQYWQRDVDHNIPDIQPDILEGIPLMNVNVQTDIEAWKSAISATKTHSAPGIDGISIAELRMLPERLLESMVSLINNLDKFPEWLMRAKTVPLPKSEKFLAKQTRPITILPTLYRIWAKVCVKEILQKLASVLPPSITGMLPQRGALNASYDLQAMLEEKRFLQTPIAGVTLDLRKCFNLVIRQKAKQTLRAYGIPAEWIQKWFDSLTQMQRYWQIQQEVSTLIPANNGIPEGDPWSVAIMVCISSDWVRGLDALNQDIGSSAYADNWSFWQAIHKDHSPMISHTLAYTSQMGLEIDWDKTWIWSTCSSGHKPLQSVINTLVPEAELQKRNNACDLGCQVTYYGNPKLGSMQERFQKAKKRAQVLKLMGWDLSLKNHMLLTSILPVAFYGAELIHVGQAHFDTLRSHFSQALVGETVRSLNPAVFLHSTLRRQKDS